MRGGGVRAVCPHRCADGRRGRRSARPRMSATLQNLLTSAKRCRRESDAIPTLAPALYAQTRVCNRGVTLFHARESSQPRSNKDSSREMPSARVWSFRFCYSVYYFFFFWLAFPSFAFLPAAAATATAATAVSISATLCSCARSGNPSSFFSAWSASIHSELSST